VWLPSAGEPSPGEGARSSSNRIRLFRIQPGFLSDPVGLDSDETPADGKEPEPDSSPDWFTVSFGNDNPYFDFRRKGDPGGLGYYRVSSQVQLLDSKSTACSLALLGVTPTGQEENGVSNQGGPTVVTPALSVFHALNEGLALQGYVGKHVLLQPGGSAPVQQDLRCGMAVQKALTPARTGSEAPLGNVYLSVGALGSYRSDPDRPRPVYLEVVPGVHWKMTENCWLSGGVSVPVGPSRTETGGLWQLTCSFKF
jgi:hypothetical protein